MMENIVTNTNKSSVTGTWNRNNVKSKLFRWWALRILLCLVS